MLGGLVRKHRHQFSAIGCGGFLVDNRQVVLDGLCLYAQRFGYPGIGHAQGHEFHDLRLPRREQQLLGAGLGNTLVGRVQRHQHIVAGRVRVPDHVDSVRACHVCILNGRNGGCSLFPRTYAEQAGSDRL